MDYQYRVGGSLAHNHPTYVERKADKDLLSALKKGKFCYVFNCRQMGKSSLRVRSKHCLQEMGMDCASVDITSIGSNDNLSQWYNGIIAQLFLEFNLAGKLNLKTWLREKEDLPPVQRLGQFIEEILLVYCLGEKIYIFIDEIDKILSLKFSLDDFFSLIRYCYNQRAENLNYERITFALFGVETPSDLIREKTQTSFNIGEAIELTGFTIEEVQPLETGLSQYTAHPQKTLEEIIFWTGGQPFLTQKLCQLITENNSSNSIIEEIIQEKVIKNWESQDEPVHFRTIADRLLRNEQKAGRLLGIYQQILEKGLIDIDDSPEQAELRLSGLVVKKDHKLLVYNPIYKAIFNENWVAQQLNKLRPYSESIEAWQSSNYTDESRLLRGQALQFALDWSIGKSLSNLDYQFLTASQNLDKRTAEINLETERKANQILANANRKATRRIQIGSAILALSLIVTAFAFKQAWNKEREVKIGTKLQQMGDASLKKFQFDQIESLLSAMQATQDLKKIAEDGRKLEDYPTNSPPISLQYILDDIEEKNQLEGHQGEIYSASISPDGNFIATAGEDKIAQIWNRKGEKIITLKGHQGKIYNVTFSSDSQKILTASEDKTAKIWNLKGQVFATFRGHKKSVYSAGFSPNGQIVATTSRDGTARLWDLKGNLLQILRGHQESIDDVSFSPDGQTLATASRDGTIRIWDVRGQLLLTLGQEGKSAFYSVSFSPDGQKIAAADRDKTVKIWDKKGNLILMLKGHQDFVNSVNFSPTGKMIATASSDGTAKVWNKRGEEIKTLRGHQESVFDAVFSPDEKEIVTVSSDRTAKVWDIHKLSTTPKDSISSENISVSIDPNRSRIAIATKKGDILLLDSQGKKISSFSSKINFIYSLSFSPDGHSLAVVGRKGQGEIWNLENGMIRQFQGDDNPFYSVTFNLDGTELITGSSDGMINYWRLNTKPPKLRQSFRADDSTIYSIAVSPDGQRIATASRGTLKIWDNQGKLLQTIDRDSFPIYGVSFSPDGQQIATISRDGTVRRWDSQGNLRAEFKIEEGIVYSIAFSADGKQLMVVPQDGKLRSWLVESESDYLQRLLDRGCLWLRDYLMTHPKVREEFNVCQESRGFK